MEQEALNFNTEIARYVVIVLASPFWVPFIKKVWNEVENALREEGGVFGRAPNPTQLEEIRRQRALEEDPLVNEPFVHGMAPSSGRSKTSDSGPRAAGAPNPPRRSGFRS